MKCSLTLFTILLLPAGIMAQNTFPATGNVGIGTTSPASTLHLVAPGTSTYIALEKATTSYETGIVFKKAGNPIFYIFSDNGNDALKIQASGLANENDDNPRIMLPLTSRDLFFGLSGGNVGIGTQDPKGYRLAVNGSAIFTKAVVKQYSAWPDYVFEPTYRLPSLQYVESFIKTNRHLPGIPSAAEVERNGVDLGENQAAMLKKIEELTLYVIELKKEIEALKKKP